MIPLRKKDYNIPIRNDYVSEDFFNKYQNREEADNSKLMNAMTDIEYDNHPGGG